MMDRRSRMSFDSSSNVVDVDNQPSPSTGGAGPGEKHQMTVSAAEFQLLDPRVITLWRVTHLIGFGVLLLVELIAAIVLALEEPAASPWVFVAWLAFAALFTWLSLWRPGRLYQAWAYRIDEKVLETRSGLIFRILRLLPLSRLQHVDLHRGPLERAFGLASLVLHTAGTHEANITIPGLDEKEAVRLRDHLIEVGGDDAV